MKIDRNRIVFISVVVLVVVFMIFYTMGMMNDDNETDTELKQTSVPELKEEQKEYSSKLEAVNNLKEVRESNAPSIYDEALLDSTGLYVPDLKEKERERIVDSIYRYGRIDYAQGSYRNTSTREFPVENSTTKVKEVVENTVKPLDFSKAHKAFFNSKPLIELSTDSIHITDDVIAVTVNGEQTVKTNTRLELRLVKDAIINNNLVPRNALVFGFVSFKANRVMIHITNINHRAVNLKAFDLLDGNEGIYIENSFRAEASHEVVDDMVQDINLPGVPQVGGIKQVFRRSNRHVKVTIYNQYQLILKPSL